MGKLLKFILAGGALLVAAIVAVAVLLATLFNPNDFKQEIRQLALEQAGIDVQINGDIDWAVFPSLALTAGDVKAQFAGQSQLASLDSMQFAVELQPLLSGQVKMSDIVVQGLELTLVRDKDGQSNWQASATQPSTEGDSISSSESDTTTSPVTLDIQSLTISDAKLSLDDQQSGQKLALDQLALSTGPVRLDQPIDIALALKLSQQQQGQLPLTLSLDSKATLVLDLAAKRYRLEPLSADYELVKGPAVKGQVRANIDLDLAANRLAISSLETSAGPLKASGSLAVEPLDKPLVSGKLAVAQFNLKELLASFNLPAPTTADASALTSVALTSDIAASAEQLQLSNLNISLDKSSLSGNLSHQLSSGRSEFNLQLNQLQLDSYLPPQQASTTSGSSQGGSETTASSGYSKQPVIDPAPLKALNLAGKLKAGKLSYQGNTLSDINLSLSASGGLVKVERLTAKGFGGSIDNQLTLDARKQPLRISGQKKLRALDISQLLKAAGQQQAPLSGKLNMTANINASGRSVHSIVNSLGGKVNLELNDGVIQGLDMAQQLCQTMNSVSSLGGTISQTQQVDQGTPFARMGGNFTINKGVVNNKDLAASLDAMRLAGRGSFNLPAQTLDYRVGLTIDHNLFNKSCSINNSLEGIEWPVDCKGSFNTPPAQLCRPDPGVIEDIVKRALKRKYQAELDKKKAELEQKAKQKLQQETQKLEDKLKDKLGDEGKEAVKGLLKGLF